MFEALDNATLSFFGQFAHKSEAVDKLITWVLMIPTYKLLPIVTCLWFLWFIRKDNQRARLCVLYASFGAVLGLVVARAIQNLGPMRPRPVDSGNPNFIAPYGMEEASLKDWSSFPSDHAALTFALAAGIFMYSRLLGVLNFAWALFIVCVPRMYAGRHYASDILVGGIIGILAIVVLHRSKLPFPRLLVFVEDIERKHMGVFYSLAFIVAYQIVTMFDDIRKPADALLNLIG
jgi:membrane-associated phospholipid phosphatase